MPNAQLTKSALAAALRRLAAVTPLDKISVGAIAAEANINRQTFYYHFKDKQALICWIFDRDLEGLTDKQQNNTLLDDLIEYLHSEKNYYQAALLSNEQNCLKDHIFEILATRIGDFLKANAMGKTIDETEAKFLSTYFALACVGVLVKWAQEGMRDSLSYFNIKYADITERCLEFILSSFV